jgi:NAD+ synthase
MDLIVHAYTRGLSASEAAGELGYRSEQILRAYRDIEQKRVTTQYLHQRPLLVEPVPIVIHPESSGRS